MIIFLYGPDSYRRRQKLKEITAQYRQKHITFGDFDFGGVDAEEEFLRLKEFASNVSIFETLKLGVLENAFGEFLKENQSAFVEFLKNNLKNQDLTLVVCAEKKPLKNLSFLLKKPALAQEFKNLEGEQLKFFIGKEAEKRGLNLAPAAIVFLAEVFGGDTWALISELEKISLFNLRDFDAGRLKELVVYYKSLNSGEFFSQLSGLSVDRSLRQKIVNLEFLLNRGEEPAKIFNILAASSRNSSETVKRFADYDAAIKSGKTDYEEALLDMALS
ncbi:MAG: hypothetical protein AAB366_03535 [Patescibacteria group bacterium]